MAAVERIVLVHGSVVGGRATWREQRRAGVEGAELVVLERPGFAPGPLEDVDFDHHADWLVEQLREGDHLVGHSYGGVVALLAAARQGRGLGSLTVIEPPCTRVALDDPVVAEFARGGAALYASARDLEPLCPDPPGPCVTLICISALPVMCSAQRSDQHPWLRRRG